MPLPLPITPARALAKIIDPTSEILPGVPWNDRADVALLAIALQESGLAARVQRGGGPARGLWQFEQGGAVHGVMTHPATAKLAAQLLAKRGVPKTERSAYLALPADDLLACGFARLLLFTDRAPLPALGEADALWAYYLRNWRPGHPWPEHWATNYAMALDAVRPEAIA